MAGGGWRARAEALRPLISDPCGPMVIEGRGAIDDSRRRWANQRRRRSQILGSARQLVAESGLDNVHMQAVADRSGVSVQTLYNLVGNRTEMLGSAASEWILMMAASAEDESERDESSTIFTMIELFWAGAILQRDYATNLIRAQTQSDILERPFLRTTYDVMTIQLKRLQAADGLIRWASVPLLARQLAASSHACVRDWLAEPYDEGRFRDTMVNSCGLLLRGALKGSEVDRLERGIDAC